MTGDLLKDTGCKPQAHGQAVAGGGPCPRCGRPRCCATAKTRDRERCRKNPHPGATICTNHGLTLAGRAAAERRQVEAAAQEALAELWPGLANVEPVTDPVDGLARMSAAVKSMAELVGGRVNALRGQIATGPHLQLLRAEVLLLDRLLDKAIKVDEVMARLGIAERHVQLEQERANVVTAAFLAALEVGGLLPEVRSLMVERFAEGLRSIVPGEVVP